MGDFNGIRGEIEIVVVVKIRARVNAAHHDGADVLRERPIAKLLRNDLKAAALDVLRQHIFDVHTPSSSMR